jgi:hypothetical protein
LRKGFFSSENPELVEMVQGWLVDGMSGSGYVSVRFDDIFDCGVNGHLSKNQE